MEFDVFISHSSIDKKEVELFVQELRKNKISAWLDKERILAGDNILEVINQGIKKALCVVLILTESFFKSSWTPLEIGLAYDKVKIIPIFAGIKLETVAQKASYLFSLRHTAFDWMNRDETLKYLIEDIEKIKEEYNQKHPLNCSLYVNKLKLFNTMGTNAICELLLTYNNYNSDDFSSCIFQSQQIVKTIINDVYSTIKSEKYNSSYLGLMQKINSVENAIDKKVLEHIKSLLIDTSTIEGLQNKISRKVIDQSLVVILDWYLTYLTQSSLPEKQYEYEIVLPNELTEADFVDMYEIDKLVLREDLIAPPEITYNWYKHNIYTHIAIRECATKKIIGYFAILPVTDELFEKIKLGDFKDNDLSTEKIRQYNMPDFYKLYIAAIGINPEYQNTSALGKLLYAAINMMYNLALTREVYITDIITEASTPQGARLCEIFKLQKLKDTSLNTALYTTSLLPPALRLHNLFGKRLIEFYKTKYNELKDIMV